MIRLLEDVSVKMASTTLMVCVKLASQMNISTTDKLSVFPIVHTIATLTS